MKKKDKNTICDAIDQDGLDYTFRCYSDFKEIKDEKFHALREAYIKAANELETYIGLVKPINWTD